jgi:hypothetical protein
MTKTVLQICPSCAENNKAKWKNPRNTAPLFLALCGVCVRITPCTHVQFWKDIKSQQETWIMPTADKSTMVEGAKVKKVVGKTASELLNG